jgi:chromosome segregation ATPase
MMMIRRSACLAGVAISILGLLLCLVGAIGVWAGKSRVDRVVSAVFTAGDDAFKFMSSRLALVQQRVDASRRRVSDLSQQAGRLKAKFAETASAAETDPSLQAASAGADAPEVESLRFSLDEMVSELKTAEGWLDAIEAVARGVHSATDSIAQIRQEVAAADGNRTEHASKGVTAGRVAEISGELADALARLEEARQRLHQMRENRTVMREFSATMIVEATELDSRFTNLSSRIDSLNARVLEAKASLAATGQRAHRWISLAAIVLTLVLLWFGVSQAFVLHRAWRFSQRQ